MTASRLHVDGRRRSRGWTTDSPFRLRSAAEKMMEKKIWNAQKLLRESGCMKEGGCQKRCDIRWKQMNSSLKYFPFRWLDYLIIRHPNSSSTYFQKKRATTFSLTESRVSSALILLSSASLCLEQEVDAIRRPFRDFGKRDSSRD